MDPVDARTPPRGAARAWNIDAARAAAGAPGLAADVLRHRHATRAEVEAFQTRRLQSLVAHAYERVPYYRALFDEHRIRPDSIRSTADLVRVPTSGKLELRAAPVRDLVARGYDPARLVEQRTSGSTGERLRHYRTWLEIRIQHLFRLRAKLDAGVRPWHASALVGLKHAPHPRDRKVIGRLMRAAGFSHRTVIDLFDPPEAQAAQLQTVAADVLIGYPGALGRLASHLLDAGIDDIRPRLVMTGAEVLTPALRRTIEAAFFAPVVDLYGSHEFNLLGWECAETGAMHLTDDALVVEVLVDGRPAAPGETGEVVVTALHLRAMPLIRYRIGDLATRGETPCRCGAPWSTVREIQGRTVEWIELPDGRLLHPYRITQAVFTDRALPVRQYQLVQQAAGRIVLRLVVPPGAPTDTIDDAARAARELLGDDVEFRIELVDRIDPEPNGKCRALRVEPAALAARCP